MGFAGADCLTVVVGDTNFAIDIFAIRNNGIFEFSSAGCFGVDGASCFEVGGASCFKVDTGCFAVSGSADCFAVGGAD